MGGIQQGEETLRVDIVPTMTVIVVDDQEEIRHLVTSHFDEIGIAARGAESAEALTSALREKHPDLILLDLSLGATDAVDIFHILKQCDYQGVVILMSGHAGSVLDHARRIGERAGIRIEGILKKPFRRRDLHKLVTELVPKAGERKATPSAQGRACRLGEAMEKGWVEFWYQPKIELCSDGVAGVESLARIRHPEFGILSPGTFLPSATEEELHALTLAAARAAISLSGSVAAGALHIAINIAGRTLQRASLLDELKLIRDREMGDGLLVLEITETDLIEDSAAAEEFATRAVLHGFGLSIDDFGSGYATFDRLRSIPFTELKLERSVVDGCAGDRAVQGICRAAVQIAHAFDAHVVAEGVEREEDLAVLRELGFDLVQGALFSMPIPPDALIGFMRNRQMAV